MAGFLQCYVAVSRSQTSETHSASSSKAPRPLPRALCIRSFERLPGQSTPERMAAHFKVFCNLNLGVVSRGQQSLRLLQVRLTERLRASTYTSTTARGLEAGIDPL